MHLRKQSRSVFALIIALQLGTSFGAIALLARMGPAIATVAEENVESLTAVEQMISALAQSFRQDGAPRRMFLDAYERAADNITESQESPLLETIRSSADDALAGDPDARMRVLDALRQLADVNREALRLADREAQRLAEAGAWAAVFLAAAAFVVVRFVANRVDRRFVMPILQIAETLDAARQGDFFRRCSAQSDSSEIRSIGEGVNQLLDEVKPS